MEAYLKVGHTMKKYGVKGQIKFYCDDQYVESLKEVDVFFIKSKGKYLPYFVEEIRFVNPAIIKFEGFDAPESLKKIASSALYVKSKSIRLEPFVESDDDVDWIGFEVIDKKGTSIGIIDDILEYPMQWLYNIANGTQNWLIPLHEDYILGIDDEKRQLNVDLPEGLLEINE